MFELIGTIWAKVLKKARGSALRGCEIHPTSKVESGSNLVQTKMDRHTFCGYECVITNCDIGPFTSIANNVVIGGGAHPMDWVGMSPVFYEGRDSVKAKFSEFPRDPVQRTTVGADVWIGQSVLVRQGVTIGHGAVIGMGSVVTRDVAPYEVVAGVPAKPLKSRFDEKTVARLLDSKWWELPDQDLARFAHLIRDPDAFLTALEKERGAPGGRS